MPNITKRTFTHSTEFVCWFVKGKNWVFNYKDVKEFNPHKTKEGNHKQMRDFFDFIEIPIVQGRERIKGNDGRAIHPTQKPEKLLKLIIRVVQKLKFLNNFRLKTAKCRAFCATCERTHKVLEQVH
jgi:site-specific DNA-methyltransferase (adenine-specific)/modification methylase